MPYSSIDDITSSFKKTTVSLSGVSFKGKSLKLDSEEDAEPVVESIESCKNLEYLNLEGNTVGVQAAKAISKALEKHPEFNRALWKDMFTGRMKTEIPKALEFLGNSVVKAGAKLVEIDLSDNAFGPIGLEGLASLLRSSVCFGLEELRLNNNGLGITGGKLLAAALLDCYNSSKNEGKPLALKVFIAGRNRLENDGASALATVFKTMGTLEEIAMPQNGIYHVGISALSDAFTYNNNLASLNLNDNTMGVKGMMALSKALPSLQNLKYINLGDCLLKTEGAKLLADSLHGGHIKLEELILGYNEIKKDGGLALAVAMKNKVNLKNLMLDGNQFGEAGKEALQNKMKDIGKFNTLADLIENESEDSDSDQEKYESDNETENQIVNVDTASASGSEGIAVKTFFANPTAENFLHIGDNMLELFLKEVDVTNESYLETFIPILMKVSSLSTNNNEKISKSALNYTEQLYKTLFEWAEKKDKLSIVNNALLVHLELIKSEDKKIKAVWSIESCLFALEYVIKRGLVPESTKLTLKTFLDRQVLGCSAEISNAKKKISSILV